MARRRLPEPDQPELFSLDVTRENTNRLGAYGWPEQGRFPVNQSGETVRRVVWPDLAGSVQPLLAVGYSSIGQLIRLIADWEVGDRKGARLRVVLGSEPFSSARMSFAAPEITFAEAVREHWYARGISLARSAQLVAARDAVRDGRAEIRAVVGSPALHAKVYVGDEAASLGSSNLTFAGLQRQIEANARFVRAEDPERYAEVRSIAENLWEVGKDWSQAFVDLLDGLLQVVSWQEALGRACSELLDGGWFTADPGELAAQRLWPSQVVGIAQAMWIIERVGSVLVADATGSGKTRMGAHMVRAVRDRLLSTGRTRSDLTVLVCPPAVEETWRREAVATGLSLNTVSHGLLSRAAPGGPRVEGDQVRQAQLLAVDEAHNFLNPGSQRTQMLRDNAADHVLLFTATPISRGATDLLDLVALLGPDNFDDRTHATLRRLERRRRLVETLTEEEAGQLREEIQRFTLRRTKTQINRMVDAEPTAYLHPTTGRICRYPEHDPQLYPTGETAEDAAAAVDIRALARSLTGITQLPQRLTVPASQRSRMTDAVWLRFQLGATAGLVAHHVLAALRSSRAALYEHLHGTDAARQAHALSRSPKATTTGNVLAKLDRLIERGPPVVDLDSAVPDWLRDEDAWRNRCREEEATYLAIDAALSRISDARERAKSDLLADLSQRHARVLAFDRHPTTLVVVHDLLTSHHGVSVEIATGQSKTGRTKVQRLFAPETAADGSVVALCSDAMSEGINLQGASAMVHLDLPTTLRVAEQRVGRVDRMDSRHDRIEAWWPRDGQAFATRANERLAGRFEESQSLLGANLPIPDLRASQEDLGVDDEVEGERIVDPQEVHRDVEARLATPPDQLVDALEPVRSLVEGPEALLRAEDYAAFRELPRRVLSRVAPIGATSTWAFLAVRSASRGVPRWMLVRPTMQPSCVTDLAEVVALLRSLLRDEPESAALDEAAGQRLDECLAVASAKELELLPRRSQRSLAQMGEVARAHARDLRAQGDEETGLRWMRVAELAQPQGAEEHADPFVVAERWLELVAPRLEAHRLATRGRRYALLKDITKGLIDDPFELETIEAVMSDLPTAQPLADRVAVCILGVPRP